MARIISYSEKTGYNDGDYLLMDNGDGGTKRIRADRVGVQLDPTLTDPNKAAPANAVKPVDAVPTQGSTNAVSSGGVYDEIDDLKSTINVLEAGTEVFYSDTTNHNASIRNITVPLISRNTYCLKILPTSNIGDATIFVGTGSRGDDQTLGTYNLQSGVTTLIKFVANGSWNKMRIYNNAYNVSASIYDYAVAEYFKNEISDINNSVNSSLYAPYAVQTWTKGVVNAINSNITTSDNGATAGPIPADKITFSSGCRAVIRMWKNGLYLGKCKDDGTVDKASGHWKYFTGDVDTASLMLEFNADSVDFSILPTDGTTITSETVSTYGDSHCTILVNRFATKAMVTAVGNDVAFAQNTADYAQSSVANVKVINHRGFNTVAPENTIPAFELSAQHGFAYVETDVLFTAPDNDNPIGVPVLLHDASINRTARNADGTELPTTVNIADITYADALEYDFGIWKNAEYAGTKIPTFADFIRLCKRYGLHPYIELKNEKTYTQDEIDMILDIVTKNGMKKHVSFISYDTNALLLVKNRWDWVELGLHTSGGGISGFESLMTDKNEVFATHGMNTAIPNIINAGIPACPYTVDTVSQLQNLDPYYSYILTNVLTTQEIMENMFAVE